MERHSSNDLSLGTKWALQIMQMKHLQSGESSTQHSHNSNASQGPKDGSAHIHFTPVFFVKIVIFLVSKTRVEGKRNTPMAWIVKPSNSPHKGADLSFSCCLGTHHLFLGAHQVKGREKTEAMQDRGSDGKTDREREVPKRSQRENEGKVRSGKIEGSDPRSCRNCPHK